MVQIFYGYTEGVAVEQKDDMDEEHSHGLSISEALTFTKVDVMEGVQSVLEANGVDLPPTWYPSKGVCDLVGVLCSFGMNVIQQDCT